MMIYLVTDSNSGSDTEEQYMEKPQERISEEEYQQSQSSGDPAQDDREKTDQSQQTTPTTPPADCKSTTCLGTVLAFH